MKKFTLSHIFAFLLLKTVYSQNGCRLTTRDVEGPFFEKGAPVTNQIAPNGDFNPSTEIQLQGRILDKRCRPISNAVVDVWYAGGNPVAYTFPPSTLWYRGKTFTDKNGQYSFRATYPGSYSGRPIPHVHYKVRGGGKELVTQMYFRNNVPRSYEDYVVGRNSQFPSVRATSKGRTVTFDLVLDV